MSTVPPSDPTTNDHDDDAIVVTQSSVSLVASSHRRSSSSSSHYHSRRSLFEATSAPAVPLLQGLSHSNGSMIVDAAVRHHEAIGTLQRGMRLMRRRKRQHHHDHNRAGSGGSSNGSSSSHRLGTRAQSKEASTRAAATATTTLLRSRKNRNAKIPRADEEDDHPVEQRKAPPTTMTDNETKKTKPNQQNRREHWLWTSVRAYSASERMTAVQILLDSYHHRLKNKNSHTGDCSSSSSSIRKRSTSADSDKEEDEQQSQHLYHWNFRLTQCWIQQMQQHVVMLPTVSRSESGCRHRLAVEWTAVLRLLILQQQATHRNKNSITTMTAASENDNVVALTYLHWDWLCRAIWTVASSSDSPTPATCPVAVTALARLCVELVLVARLEPTTTTIASSSSSSSDTDTQKEDAVLLKRVQTLNTACLWNPNRTAKAVLPPTGSSVSPTLRGDDATPHPDNDCDDTPLSPLACLVGAAFLTRDPSLLHLIEYSSVCRVSSSDRRGRPPPPKPTVTESVLERVSREALESVLERCRDQAVMEAFESHMAASSSATNLEDVANNTSRKNNNSGGDEEVAPRVTENLHSWMSRQHLEEELPNVDNDGDVILNNDDDEGEEDVEYDEEVEMESLNSIVEEDSADEEDERVGNNADGDIAKNGGPDTSEEEHDEEQQQSNEEVNMQQLQDVVLHDDDDDEDDDHDDDDMDLEELQAVVAAREASRQDIMSTQHQQQVQSSLSDACILERRRLYVQASMQVLCRQYSPIQTSSNPKKMGRLRIDAENALLASVCKIVKPPAEIFDTKIILRRAPTQEEFFRGSLSRNPVPVSLLQKSDPTVSDLIQHVANDLQMADSAELIEIIVANKILDVNLKIRVVHQVLWKNLLIENNNNTASSLGGGASLFSSGSALSIILSGSSSSGGSRLVSTGASRITAETPPSALPPIMAMYRLAGVDGEATEDIIGVDDLVDPESNTNSLSSAAQEALLESEYGLTRLVTPGRGVAVLLRSVQTCVSDVLRRVRRDYVGLSADQKNPSLMEFTLSPPCHALVLLRYCCMLADNRRMLLEARAPTVLLTLLLEVLKALETSSENSPTTSNATAEIFQELIEKLTSDISSTGGKYSNDGSSTVQSDTAQDAASMSLLLQSIETISLSPPLRGIIAKLLPFLTYGRASMSRDLARHFDTHIDAESLARMEHNDEHQSLAEILVNTFVQSAMSLPANKTCNSLRSELTNNGFVDKLTMFVLKAMPKKPAPWSHAMWQKSKVTGNGDKMTSRENTLSSLTTKQRHLLEDSWRSYYCCEGIRTAFKILTGLCRQHSGTQERIAKSVGFMQACHWLESTSDSVAARVETRGLGLLAETLLDEVAEQNVEVAKLVKSVREKTRRRKKELALEQREKTLLSMGSFGATLAREKSLEPSAQPHARSGLASILAPVVGLFQTNPTNGSAPPYNTSSSRKRKLNEEIPAWLAEAEQIQDEVGLTCAVCQEGRTFQPTELLGLYCFIKKVSIPMELCGSRVSIDGTNLLKALPSTLPLSLFGTTAAEDWFPSAKAAASNLSSVASASLTVSSSTGRRNSLFTTTVSAGNGIHFSCHRRARQADRSHPKAPKTEWEGATLRNNRVSCNVILPLITCQSANVPLVAIDAALTDHMSAVTNLLGGSPKSSLWTVLHDVRLLLLRVAYGESLSADCGGGSIASNCHLLFHQFLMVDMNEKNAQLDQPEHSSHVRALSSGLLAACAIVTAKDSTENISSLTRGIADTATMACITAIIFHNTNSVENGTTGAVREVVKPSAKRQWLAGKDYFLQSLLICAGRRHARGMDGSGCVSTRTTTNRRSSTFTDWDHVDTDSAENVDLGAVPSVGRLNSYPLSRKRRGAKPSVEDFQNAIRPMVTLYAIMDQVSAEYTPSMSMNDAMVDESVHRVVNTINECQRSSDIHELLQVAKVTMDHNEIIELLQKGMVSL